MTADVIPFPNVPPVPPVPACSFCHQPGTDKLKLLVAPSGFSFICTDCLAVCTELVKEA